MRESFTVVTTTPSNPLYCGVALRPHTTTLELRANIEFGDLTTEPGRVDNAYKNSMKTYGKSECAN